MLGYIPRSIQLKLFRYALSKLDFLDHSAYDVERDFNLSIGLRNELEMRNIRLNVAKLTSIASLPPNVKIQDAVVSRLHIRIPTDFHRTPVKVTISGIKIIGSIVFSDEQSDTSESEYDPARDDIANRTLSESFVSDHDGGEHFDPIGLTASFLQDRPSEAREIEDALNLENVRTPAGTYDSQSYIDDDDNDGTEVGIGVPLSFWNFVPSFFGRLVDRLEMDIRDISITVEMPVSSQDMKVQGNEDNHLTMEIRVSSLDIEGVTGVAGVEHITSDQARQAKTGMRAIRLDGIEMSLLSGPEFFESSPAPSTHDMSRSDDMETVRSDSTVLPMTQKEAPKTANDSTVATENLPSVASNHQASSTFESSDLHSVSIDPGTVHQMPPFFAAMQEPNYSNDELEPSRSPSHVSLPSPQPSHPPRSRSGSPPAMISISAPPPLSSNLSPQSSAGSDDTDDRLLSESMYIPEVEHELSQSDLYLEDPENDFFSHPNSDYLRESEHSAAGRYADFSGEDEEEDVENDVHDSNDSNIEPKSYLAVSTQPTHRYLQTESDELDPDASSDNNRIADPPGTIHREAEGLASSEDIARSVESHGPQLLDFDVEEEIIDAQTPGRPFKDDPEHEGVNEYSNPDFLYLSEHPQSISSSTAGSLQHSMLADILVGDESHLSGYEPKVIYTNEDNVEDSDDESVYESYPPSEADLSLVTQNLETPTAQPEDPNPMENDEEANHLHSSSKEPSDGEDIKVRTGQRDPGSNLENQKLVMPPEVLIQHLATSGTRSSSTLVEDRAEQSQMSPDSHNSPESLDIQDSENGLSESMIFSHEEAGSLYMSAIGDTRYRNSPTLDDERRGSSPDPVPLEKQPRLLMKKSLFKIEYIDVFVPSIVPAEDTKERQIAKDASTGQSLDESVYPSMPGTFYSHTAGRSEHLNSSRNQETSRARSKQTVSFDVPDKKATRLASETPLDQSANVNTSNKIIANLGKIQFSFDIVVAKRLYSIVSDFTKYGDDVPSTSHTDSEESSLPAKANQTPSFSIHLSHLDIRWVERMSGLLVSPLHQSPDLHSTWSEDSGSFESFSILNIIVKQLNFTHSSELEVVQSNSRTRSEIKVQSCSINMGSTEIMGFVPSRSTDTLKRRKEDKATKFDGVLSIIVQQTPLHRRIAVHSRLIKLYFPAKEIEETCAYFGGIESMLVLASNSSLSPRASRVPNSHNVSKKSHGLQMKSKGPILKTSLRVDISGIAMELFVSDVAGGVGLSSSPIKVELDSMGSLSIRISGLAIFGPDIASTKSSGSSTLVALENLNLSMDQVPGDEDLERLLRMITPSTDRFDNDDLMIDVLLRQRRQGTVLRLEVDTITGRMNSLSDVSRFSIIAEELAKTATVAKYIPQDERPGMLSLIRLNRVNLDLLNQGPVNKLSAILGDVELCHIATPSLLAVSIEQISCMRNSHEELVGESLPREIATAREEDKRRPMIKIRMVGDEPEPEIKVKIWNLRLEYHVDTVLALLSMSEASTTDVMATNMVDSIVSFTEREIARQNLQAESISTERPSASSSSQPLRLNIGLSSVCFALNPLNHQAKGLALVQDGAFTCEVSPQKPFSAYLSLQKANLLVIDSHKNLLPSRLPRKDTKDRGSESKEDLVCYTAQGYVPVLSLTSASLNFHLEDAEDHETENKNMSIEVQDVFVVIESCADSTQTVITILNGLKPPLPESEEIKYMTQVMPIDVFANLDEDAFVPKSLRKEAIPYQSRNLISLEEMPEDLLEDEVPFNSQFIESYYPSSAIPTAENASSKMQTFPGMLSSGFLDQVRVVAEEPLNFNDAYFRASSQTQDQESVVKPIRSSVKASVRNVQLLWNLHDGYDWPRTREAISTAIKDVEDRATHRRRRQEKNSGFEEMESDEECETYDVLFNSIYITLPANRDPKDLSKDIQAQLRGDYDTQSETGSYAPTTTTLDSQSPRRAALQDRRSNAKYQRSRRNAMQFELKGVDVDFAIFAPEGQELQSSVDLRVNDLTVTENVRTSTWRMFLTYMREAGVRERGIPMAHIHIDTLRPVPDLAATELSLKVKLLPLRLYVDQDALEFLTRFFEFKDADAVPSTVKAEEPFIQRCEVDTVRLKLDFKPKRVDYAGLRSGRTTEFMNFFILEEAEMELRHVALNGVSGFERLGKDLNNIWTPDVKQNQLGGVLAGVAPVRSLVNLGTGVRDLVKVPIIEYRKDGRLVRSIKKGTQNFVKTSGSEIARFGAKIAIGTQTILEKTEEFLVGESAQPRHYAPHREPDSGEDDGETHTAVFSPYADQPLSLYKGLVQAKEGMARNFGEAREAILRIPSEAAREGSAQGAAAVVMRAAPTAIIRPMIGVTEAVHKTLHGIDNTIDKEKREKLRDKYKKR